MAWCDHWLMQYQKTCIGVRLWAEHPWEAAASLFVGAIVLLLIAHALGRIA